MIILKKIITKHSFKIILFYFKYKKTVVEKMKEDRLKILRWFKGVIRRDDAEAVRGVMKMSVGNGTEGEKEIVGWNWGWRDKVVEVCDRDSGNRTMQRRRGTLADHHVLIAWKE